MEFKRGDTCTHEIDLPSRVIEDGVKLHFMAKQSVDNDDTDARAVISRTFTEANIVGEFDDVDSRGNPIKLKRFRMVFDPADTAKIKIDDDCSVKLLGEFELRYTDGRVISIPGDSNFYQVVVHADIRRGGNG